jgi:hypothetical protein
LEFFLRFLYFLKIVIQLHPIRFHRVYIEVKEYKTPNVTSILISLAINLIFDFILNINTAKTRIKPINVGSTPKSSHLISPEYKKIIKTNETKYLMLFVNVIFKISVWVN